MSNAKYVPATGKTKTKPRFKAGDRVTCCNDELYETGTVLQHIGTMIIPETGDEDHLYLVKGIDTLSDLKDNGAALFESTLTGPDSEDSPEVDSPEGVQVNPDTGKVEW